MSEIVDQAVDTPLVVEEPQTPVLTEVEQRAVEMGWMPKEQWVEAGNDPGKHRSAELFVELEPLFGKIESLKKEVRSGKKTLDALKTHYEKVSQSEYKRALDDLKAQKRIALEDGDAASVVEIDEDIAETKEMAKRAAAIQAHQEAQEIHPEFAEWVADNQWYATDRRMQAFADAEGRAFASENPGLAPKDVLRHVEKEVRKRYPEKFKNPAQSRPGAVEAPKQTAKKGGPAFELTAEERQVMNKLVKSGVLTEEKYIADLKKVRGV